MEVKMKITKKQLRQLIETTIKPSIPKIPNDNALGKVDDLARASDHRFQADSLAGTFGYPEDRSYSTDLKDYDEIGMIPQIESEKDMIINTMIELYDEELYGYELDAHIGEHYPPVLSDDKFNEFLRMQAREIYVYSESKYGDPFHGSTIHGVDHPMEREEALRRIERALLEL
tara:strand:+ start:16 stop:534 length:519 start_codon:yes stop_codon:yes gene_type:complete